MNYNPVFLVFALIKVCIRNYIIPIKILIFKI